MSWWDRSRVNVGGFITTVIIFAAVLIGAAIATDALDIEKGRALVDTQLLGVLFVVSMLGMAGGLAYDITEPLRPGKSWRSSDFENRTSIPSLKKGVQEWGFLGPMLVGAVAAIAVLFLIGIERLPESDTATPSAQVILLNRLIALPLIAGFAGSLALRVLRSRLAAALRITELTEAAAQAKSALEKVAEPTAPAQNVEAALQTVEAAKDAIAAQKPDMAALEANLTTLIEADPGDGQAADIQATRDQILGVIEDAFDPAIEELDKSVIVLKDVPEAEAGVKTEVGAALERIDSVLQTTE